MGIISCCSSKTTWEADSGKGGFTCNATDELIGITVVIPKLSKSYVMMVFSTVLEVNGSPIVYNVYKNGELAFFSPNRTRNAPILFARADDRSWEIKGTNDSVLLSQALREIAAAS